MSCSHRAIALVAAFAAATAPACRRLPAEPEHETVRMLAGGPISEVFLHEYQRALPAFRITMEATRGSDFVVSALQHGVADVGFAQADVVYLTYRAGLAERAH